MLKFLSKTTKCSYNGCAVCKGTGNLLCLFSKALPFPSSDTNALLDLFNNAVSDLFNNNIP